MAAPPEALVAAIDAELDAWVSRRAARTDPTSTAPGSPAPGGTVHLHATDADAALDAEWVVDLGAPHPGWRRAHEKSSVAVRAPLADLAALVQTGDVPAACEVLGDAALLGRWLGDVTAG